MGEPFSVAGTVVGITSLGIQTCQILHRYYSQYRGHHDDIETVLNQVEGLRGILNGLKQVTQRIELDNHESSSQLQIALLAFEDVLKKLENMALKCQAEKDPGDVQARIRAVLKRSAWPFKKDTLADLRDMLIRFQDNLSLALQSAGLDAVLREVDGIQPALGSLHAQNMVIQERQGHQLDTLRGVHGDIATSFEYQRWSHQEISHDLSDVQRQLSQYGESLQFITKVLVASSASPRDLSTVSPSLLSEAAHTVDAIAPAFETTLHKHRSLFHESNVRRNRRTAIAACHCRPKKRTAATYRRWYSVFSESIYTHELDCPRYAHADYSETIAMQFIISTRVVGACIQAGLQRSQRGGWSSISPTLRYCAVRPDSAAFKILKDARIQIYNWERSQKGSSHSKLPQFASETFSALQICFGKDAHPTDLDEDGNGIMNYVLDLIKALIENEYSDSNMLCTFIDTCIAQGVPIDQHDVPGRAPVMLWQSHMMDLLYGLSTENQDIDTCREVLLHLTRTLDIWMFYSYSYVAHTGAVKYYAIISDIVSIEEFNLNLDEDDPLAQAIMRRSETKLSSFLNVAKVAEWASLPERAVPMEAITCWPEGVQLLIGSGLFHPSDDVVVGIWKRAIPSNAWDTLQILLDFGVQVAKEDWDALNLFHEWCADYTAHEQRTFDQVAEVYHSMAMQFLRYSGALLGSPSRGTIDSLILSSHETRTLYHSSSLSVQGAEATWLAGLHDLNTVCGIQGTPLWVCATNQSSGWYWDWETARWLMSHGADLTWTHPVYLTTPAHILMRRSVAKTCLSLAEDKANIEPRSLLYSEPVTQVCELLLSGKCQYQLDECVCHCSKDGCSTFSCAVSSSSLSFGKYSSYDMPKPEEHAYHHKKIRPYLFSLVDRVDQSDLAASSILRVLTFEKLHLPHTCCYRVMDEVPSWRPSFRRPTPEEAMHDTNPRDLELLESLMKKFEAEWSRYKKPFATFVKRVWKPRMRRIRKKREINQEVYEAELIGIGITLRRPEECNPHNWDPPETDSDDDSDTGSESENGGESGNDDGYETADEEAEDGMGKHQDDATSNEHETGESNTESNAT